MAKTRKPKDLSVVARIFASAFTPNPLKHGVMKGYEVTSGRKLSTTVHGAVTEQMVLAHLQRVDNVGRLGYLPGREDGTDVICIDIDQRALRSTTDEVADAVLKAARRLKLTPYHEYSTNAGRHIWIFLDDLVAWENAYWLAKAVCYDAGHSYLETFPSSEASGAEGKWIYMPYSGAMHESEDRGHGLSNLMTWDWSQIPVWKLEHLTRSSAAQAEKLANQARLELRKQLDEAEQSGELLQDLRPEAFNELRRAVMEPPETGFRRHDALACFLNLAMRASQLPSMTELLSSSEVFNLWVSDGSRTLAAWEDEIRRWAERIQRDSGELRSRYGIKALLEMGWTIGKLDKRPELDLAHTQDINKVPEMDLAVQLWEVMKAHGEHWWYDPEMVMGYRWDGRTYVARPLWEYDIKSWVDRYLLSIDKNIREGKLTAVYTKLERTLLARKMTKSQDPDLIACENGVLNWREGVLLAPSPDIITLGRVNASWDETAEPERDWVGGGWHNYLAEVLRSEKSHVIEASIASMAEYFGYCLMPLNEHAPVRDVRKVLNFHGPSSTGKTTTWRAVLSVLGDQAEDFEGSGIAMSADQELFASQDWAQKLVGKRLVVFDEMNTGGNEGRKIINALKVLAGNGAVTINPKGKKSMQSRLGCRLLLCTNYGLRLFEDSANDAFFRRLLRIPFSTVVSRQDERAGYAQALVQSEEVRTQMLLWMVDGLRRLASNSWRFTGDLQLAELLSQDREDANPVISFLRQRAHYDENSILSTTDILHQFNAWAGEQGMRFTSSIQLGHKMADALGYMGWGPRIDRTVRYGYRMWKGIALSDAMGEMVESMTLVEMERKVEQERERKRRRAIAKGKKRKKTKLL